MSNASSVNARMGNVISAMGLDRMAVQFVVVGALLLSLVLGAFGAWEYGRTTQVFINEADAQVDDLVARLQTSMPTALWEFNDPQVRSVIDAEMRSNFLSGVEVLRLDGSRVYSVQRLGVDQSQVNLYGPKAPRQVVIDINYQQAGERYQLGRVYLSVSYAYLSDGLDTILFDKLAQALALLVFMSAAVYVTLMVVVLRPFKRISQAMLHIATGESDLSLRLPTSHTTELREVTQSFNMFVAKLAAVMGGTVNDVHHTIKRVAQGQLDQVIEVQPHARFSIMGRLALMQRSLRDLQDGQKNIHALLLAKDNAVAENTAKSDYLATMNHEIRTPLNAIIGLSSIALASEDNDDKRDKLMKIYRSGQHLLQLVDDSLSFSKLEADKVSIESVPFDLETVLSDAADMVQVRAVQKSLEIICDVDSDVPLQLVGDPLRIGQVLINYLSNAIKFTEQGEICVHVGTVASAIDAATVSLRFEVRDTGIGLTHEQSLIVFESYTQAQTSTSRSHGGTGLGLTISKRLAELMGGHVGVNSIPGVGSTFFFVVKVSKDVSTSKAVPSLLASTAGQPAPNKGRRVLVVDGNATAGSVLSGLLIRAGCRSEHVLTAHDALLRLRQETAKRLPFDVLIFDAQLAGHDGASFVKAATAAAATPRLVFALTVLNESGPVAESASQAGVALVLLKPVNQTRVLRLLSHIEGRGAEAPSSEPNLAAGPAIVIREPSPRWSVPQLPDKVKLLQGKRVLLAEDNLINQEVTTHMLEAAGLVVTTVTNGALALEALTNSNDQQPFDLVLMDMQMPVMNGLLATQELRKHFGDKLLPVIAMTANTTEQDRQACIAAGMNDFLSKPVRPVALWEMLMRWLAP